MERNKRSFSCSALRSAGASVRARARPARAGPRASLASGWGQDRRGVHRRAANPYVLLRFVSSAHMLPHVVLFITCCHILPYVVMVRPHFTMKVD